MIGRLTTILAQESAATAGTKSLDLNIANPISQIVVQMKATNTDNTPEAHGAKMISKIEIVDGSDVLFSMSGVEAQAMGYYHTGVMPFIVNNYRINAMNIQTFTLDFGRYLWDRDLALDPRKFSNLQIKVTHNITSGGSSSTVGNLAVFAFVFNPGVTDPIGFLMCKELYAYSLTSSAMETISLPADRPYRKIVIQSLASGKSPHQQYNKITLTVDNDRVVLVNNESVSNLIKFSGQNAPIVESIAGRGTGSGVDHYTSISYNGVIGIGCVGSALSAVTSEEFYGGAVAILSNANVEFQAILSGYAPHGSLALPFGRQDVISDWLNTDEIGKLVLKLTAGSSVLGSSTCEITAQQLRLY